MNLRDFRQIVDQTPACIAAYKSDAAGQYAYVGLDSQVSYQSKAVGDALYERIRNAFTSGHGEARSTCRKLKTDPIREHVIGDVPLDPYFEVLSHLEDALHAPASQPVRSKVIGPLLSKQLRTTLKSAITEH